MQTHARVQARTDTHVHTNTRASLQNCAISSAERVLYTQPPAVQTFSSVLLAESLLMICGQSLWDCYRETTSSPRLAESLLMMCGQSLWDCYRDTTSKPRDDGCA